MRLSAAGLVLVLAGVPAPALAQQRPAAAPNTDQTVPVQRGSRLLVDNYAGEVVVRTWEKDALRVQARHDNRTRVNVRTLEGAVRVSASSSSNARALDYEITAPHWMPVRVQGTYIYIEVDGAQSEVTAETVRGDVVVRGGSGFVSAKSIEGDVIVEGAKGRIVASSVNEDVRITGSAADVTAESTNGEIVLSQMQSKVVEISTVNGNISYQGLIADGGRYRITTHNGNITMSVPQTINATVTVRTYNGSFHSAFGVKPSGEVRRGRRNTYVIGNGSAEIDLESFGGSIRLRRQPQEP
jgi:DUF4097 and DUF4098 domain-containing protein YvlB